MLVRRLEAATSRLEDMASTIPDPSIQPNGVTSTPGRAPAPVSDGMDEAGGTSPPPKKVFEPLPPAIDDFDAVINGDVKTFVNMSEELGGLVSEQVSRVCVACTSRSWRC